MKLRWSKQSLPFVATTAVCALLYLVGGLAFPGFFTARVFVNFFTDNAFLGVAAIGMTFVVLAGGIDLSVGAVVGCVSILMATLVEQRHIHPVVVVPLLLVFGLLLASGRVRWAVTAPAGDGGAVGGDVA